LLFGYTIEYYESDNYFESKEEKTFLLPEPIPAPPASTYEAMQRGWKTVMPDNPSSALPFRVDIYAADTPIRCMVVCANGFIDDRMEYCGKDDRMEYCGKDEGWTLVETFFAFDKKIPGTSQYSVMTSENPFRCKVEPGSGKETKCWKKELEFWAYHSPLAGTSRLKVQEVVNPVRHRISQENATRGGWNQIFCFFSYSALRIAVLDAVNCPQHHSRSKMRFSPYSEDRRIHPDINDLEIDDSDNEWCRRFEFFGFQTRFPCTNKYSVLERMQALENKQQARERNEILKEHFSWDAPCEYPAYKLVTENEGDTKGWNTAVEFYAFPIPMPGTTRYYFKINRNPTRYMITLHDFMGQWETLFTFYAYSTRPQDVH